MYGDRGVNVPWDPSSGGAPAFGTPWDPSGGPPGRSQGAAAARVYLGTSSNDIWSGSASLRIFNKNIWEFGWVQMYSKSSLEPCNLRYKLKRHWDTAERRLLCSRYQFFDAPKVRTQNDQVVNRLIRQSLGSIFRVWMHLNIFELIGNSNFN